MFFKGYDVRLWFCVLGRVWSRFGIGLVFECDPDYMNLNPIGYVIFESVWILCFILMWDFVYVFFGLFGEGV